MPELSIIIPTYQEALNAPTLLARIALAREAGQLDCEVLIMDDDSQDGISQAVDDAGFPWVRLIIRRSDRGLAPAVIDGFGHSKGTFLMVMDADLSHPPEKILELIDALRAGAEMAIGSRYVPGGSTDEQWGWFRKLNSTAATWLARPLTKARDPMSGFFALPKHVLDRAENLNPLGYKIGLELIVKCSIKDITEVPIVFVDRTAGESKLSLRQQWLYLRHLIRLYGYRLFKRQQKDSC